MKPLCKDCAHYKEFELCAHPELVSPVDGEPSECWSNREANPLFAVGPPPEGFAWCGPAGALWAARQAAPQPVAAPAQPAQAKRSKRGGAKVAPA